MAHNSSQGKLPNKHFAMISPGSTESLNTKTSTVRPAVLSDRQN